MSKTYHLIDLWVRKLKDIIGSRNKNKNKCCHYFNCESNVIICYSLYQHFYAHIVIIGIAKMQHFLVSPVEFLEISFMINLLYVSKLRHIPSFSSSLLELLFIFYAHTRTVNAIEHVWWVQTSKWLSLCAYVYIQCNI